MALDQRPTRYVLTDDTFAALVRLFMSPANPKWVQPQERGGYARSTKETWRHELSFMERPDTLGALRRDEIRPSLVQAFFDGIADRPGKQAVALTALRQLEKWAIIRDLLPRQITLGIELEKSDDGHIPWNDEQVAAGERHARPHVARMITLGANTGQRVSDLIRIGWTDIETYKGMNGIRLRQKKTGREVWVPILSPLTAAMATWERQPGPFLRRHDGKPWTSSQATSQAWVREREAHSELKEHCDLPLVVHGLRGHACVRLSRFGLTDHQIGDMIGMSPGMVSRYTRFSNTQDNVVAAVYQLQETGREPSMIIDIQNHR